MRAKQALIVSFGTLALLLASSAPMRAHKPVTSKYSYTTDLLPLFRARCGACHRPDGVAPMSLLTYQDARPWAQSIKDEVINLRMPPQYAEAGFGPVRNGHGLSASEIDKIVEWTNGGTPEGPHAAPAAAPAVAAPAWPALSSAPPDLTLALPEFTLAKDAAGETRACAVPTGLASDRFVRGVEIVPGAPSIVRSVVVSAAGRVLTIWQPDQEPLLLDPDMGYLVAARTELAVRVRYKKTWRQEGQAVTDRTSIRLWLTGKPPHKIVERLAIRDRQTTTHALEVIAVIPDVASPLDSMRVDAVGPDGSRAPLLLLSHPSPDWPARYSFRPPMTLAKGSRIEVVSAAGRGASPSAGVEVEYVR